ncbi:hypothetical protein AGMMS4952_14560 [Spirochaetia bacterium]|nr:hypothetical protein AGMMS4952_14560 [Spirochaetia bacterium]
MDYKNIFDRFEDKNGFVKTVASYRRSAPSIDGSQKVALNRKGNILYNAGDIEGAKRIFLTTGYSDGLARIGDYYLSKGRDLDALRMYWIAPDKAKAGSIIMRLSVLIQKVMHEEEDL